MVLAEWTDPHCQGELGYYSTSEVRMSRSEIQEIPMVSCNESQWKNYSGPVQVGLVLLCLFNNEGLDTTPCKDNKLLRC